MDLENKLNPEVSEDAAPLREPSGRPEHPQLPEGYIPPSAVPDVHEEHDVGEGMSKKEAMKIRMKNMNPEITEFPTVEVVVDNELIKQEIEDIQKSIAKTLQVYLHNNQIQITVRVAEQTEHVKILSRREQFEQMAEKNAAVAKLQQAFDLELA